MVLPGVHGAGCISPDKAVRFARSTGESPAALDSGTSILQRVGHPCTRSVLGAIGKPSDFKRIRQKAVVRE